MDSYEEVIIWHGEKEKYSRKAIERYDISILMVRNAVRNWSP